MKRPEIEHFMKVIENHMELDLDERNMIEVEANTLYNKLVTGRQERIDALESVLFVIEEGWDHCECCGGKSIMLKDLPITQIKQALAKAGVHMEESA